MAFTKSKQSTNGKRDYHSSFQKTSKKHILEALRSKAPSDDLRDRRRRCFIASSYSKNCGEPLVLDTSKSKRFTLAMKEDEEIEFFQSLWNSLPSMHGDDLVKAPPVATESTRPSEADCCGPAGQTLDSNQSTMKAVQVGATTATTNHGGDVDATKNTSDGHNGNSGGVKTEERIVEPYSEKSYSSEIEAKRISVSRFPVSNASKQDSFCNISEAGDSRGETRLVSAVKNSTDTDSGVECLPVESNVIDGDPNRRVFMRICPTEIPDLSQSDVCLEENVVQEGMNQQICHMDRVTTRNVCTQTYTMPNCNRSSSDQSSGATETKRKPQRNWYRHNGNAYEKRGSRGLYAHQRSPSSHRGQRSTFGQPKMTYAGHRFENDHQKDWHQSTCCDRRSSLWPSGEHSWRKHSHHVENEMDQVGCDYNRNFSRYWRANDATNREHTCSTNSERYLQMPSVSNMGNVAFNYSRKSCRKNSYKPRVQMAGDKSSRTCWCQNDDTPRDQRSSSDSEASRGNEMRVAAPRRVLVCPMCGVIVSSKKSMAAHVNGARHSRTAEEAERQGENVSRTRDNKILTCRMAYIQQPVTPVLEYVLVPKVGKHI